MVCVCVCVCVRTCEVENVNRCPRGYRIAGYQEFSSLKSWSNISYSQILACGSNFRHELAS